MSVKKRINQKTHKDKSIRKSRRIRRRLRRLRRKSRKLMGGGVKKDCITLIEYNKKLAESKIKLDNKVKKLESLGAPENLTTLSSQAFNNNTSSEREDIDFYENKIKKLNALNLNHCKDEKNILPSDFDHRRIFCTSCNSK